MKKLLLILFLIIVSDQAYPYPQIPNTKFATGHICTETNKDFERLRYAESMPYCKRNVSNSTKDKICELYGITHEERIKDYTVDHIVPLSLGGSNDNSNLWCQHKEIYSGNFEYQLYKKLESGEIRQAEAVRDIMLYKYVLNNI